MTLKPQEWGENRPFSEPLYFREGTVDLCLLEISGTVVGVFLH